MSTWWKVLLGLAVLLPLGGYVAGSLASAQAPEPTPREPVVLREAPAPSGDPSPARRDREDRGDDRRGREDDRDDDARDDDRDDQVQVVTPSPTRVDRDDDDDDRDDDRDDRDDDERDDD